METPAPVRNTASLIKGLGYSTSTVSVLLLAIVSYKAASDNLFLSAALALGVLTSMAGMFLRWRSHRLEQKEDGQA